MNRDLRWLAPLLFALACKQGVDDVVPPDDSASPPAIAPCEIPRMQVEGDLVRGLRLMPTACGHLELTDVTVVPSGALLELFVQTTGRQFVPAITGPATVEEVRWDGTFALEGDAPAWVATWPRQLGDPVVAEPLEERVVGSGGVLLGRPGGAWLLLGAVGQMLDEVVVEVTPPRTLRIVWGGRDARTVAAGDRAFYDGMIAAMGPDPQALLEAWRDEVVAMWHPEPFAGRITVQGPPASPAAVSALAEADTDGRIVAVLTDGIDRPLGDAIHDAGRAWMVRGAPFLSGDVALDPTLAEDFATIQRRAQNLVTAGVDGAWLTGAAQLAEPGPRAASDAAGIAAYRLGLQAFRSGFGDRPIVVEGALPLASVGIADAVAIPEGTALGTQIATIGALAHGIGAWFRLGPTTLSTASDDALATDLGTAMLSGGSWHLPDPPANQTQHTWLLDPGPDDPVLDAGVPGQADPPWAYRGTRYTSSAGVVTLVNPGDSTITVDGPGGRRWPTGEAAPAGPRRLAPASTEVWFLD